MKLETPIEEVDLSVSTYNQCRSHELGTVGDVIDAIKNGELNGNTKTVRELMRVLLAAGFTLDVNTEIVELEMMIDSVRRQRDAEVEAVRERYAPQLEMLRNKLSETRREMKTMRRRRVEESADDPVRHCVTCGDEMLRATMENAQRTEELAHSLLMESGVRDVGSRPLNIGIPRVNAMRRRTSCCHYCEKSNGEGHSYLCFSKRVLEERVEDGEDD